MQASDQELIEQQKAYYRVRAGEYDEWFLRQGRYDHGPAFRARWEREVNEVRAPSRAFTPPGACWSWRAAPAGGRSD